MSDSSVIANCTNDSETTNVLEVDSVNNNEFTRTNIEALGTSVRLVDSDPESGLDLFCYVSCKKNDSDLLKQCRGVIFEGNDLVLKSFPFTIEYTENDNEEILKNINLSDCMVYDSYEGSIIKIFYFKNKWFVSTNRKLDAFRSKWSSKESFGFFFNKALEYQFEVNERLRENVPYNKEVDNPIQALTSILDTNKQYMFLLLNNGENRIVCNEPSEPSVYHVGTFINESLSVDEDIYIPYPKLHNFSSLDEIYEYVDSVDYKVKQGVHIFAPNNVQYKILNLDYQELYTARGNEPSINYRYLQVRMDSKKNEMLRFLYPQNIQSFDDYENILYDVSKKIYDGYVKRFIKKQFVTLPAEEFKVMSLAHEWHQSDRTNNRISNAKIIELLNDQTPTNLNRIIRRIKLERKTAPQNTEQQVSTQVNNKNDRRPGQYKHKKLLPLRKEKKE
jgi:hypothetical protein